MSAPLSPVKAVPQPLPGWEITEVVDDVFEVDALAIHRAGITAESEDGRSAFGSAASLIAGEALPRARFELFERICIIEAHGDRARETFAAVETDGVESGSLARSAVFPDSRSESWQYSLSNGVASGETWARACEAARRELAERDAILRAWYRQVPPLPIETPAGVRPSTQSYTWQAFCVPPPPWALDLEVVAVFGFSERADLPLLRGFAAAPDRTISLLRATGECVQNLAFLAEDPLPAVAPEPTPTPMFHLDRFLCPEGRATLERWLNGQGNGPGAELPQPTEPTRLTYADLTPRSAPARHHVARAVCNNALSLMFGDGPSAIPKPLRAHPIA